jgi:hypothetical protein
VINKNGIFLCAIIKRESCSRAEALECSVAIYIFCRRNEQQIILYFFLLLVYLHKELILQLPLTMKQLAAAPKIFCRMVWAILFAVEGSANFRTNNLSLAKSSRRPMNRNTKVKSKICLKKECV